MKKNYFLFVLLLITSIGFGQATCLSEDFTNLSLGSYTNRDFTLNGLTWNGTQVIQESSTNSNGGTGKALRINDDKAGAQLTTPSLNSPQNISFYYRELNSGGGTFLVQKSVDGGAFVDVCTQAFSGKSFTQYSCAINETSSNVKLRILNDNNPGHLIIDDIEVTCQASTSCAISNLRATPVCNGDNADVTVSFNTANTTGPYEYTIDGGTSYASITSGDVITITGPTNGETYTLEVRVTNETTCLSTTDFTVPVCNTAPPSSCAAGAELIAIEDFDSSTPAWSNDIASQAFVDPSSPNEGLFIQASSGNYNKFDGNTAFARDLAGESGEPTLSPYTFTFSPVDVSGYTNLTITFDYHVLANAEVGSYQLVVDGVAQDAVEYFNDPDTGQSGTITETITSASTISLVLTGTLNGGSDVLEFDNFKICGTPLSIYNNTMDECVQNNVGKAVSGNGLVNILVDNKLVAQIDPQGNDLGNVKSGVYLSTTNRQDANGLNYMNRTIFITPDNQPSTPVKVKFYYLDAELQALITADAQVTSANDLSITEVAGVACAATQGNGTVTLIDKSNVTTGSNSIGNYLEFEVTGFSSFSAHGGSTALPVDLVDFKAEAKGSDVELSWSTTSEIDNDFFVISRSNDGVNFEELAQVDGNGTTTSTMSYDYTDNTPANGVNYYQLTQVDYDGAQTKSDMISVVFNATNALPFVNNKILFVNEIVDQIEIISLQGQLMKSVKSTNQVELQDMNTGLYLVRISNNNTMTTHKVVVR